MKRAIVQGDSGMITDICDPGDEFQIYEGADALMLSGETSVGTHPIKCIKLISKIAKQTEKFLSLIHI